MEIKLYLILQLITTIIINFLTKYKKKTTTILIPLQNIIIGLFYMSIFYMNTYEINGTFIIISFAIIGFYDVISKIPIRYHLSHHKEVK